MKRWVPSCLCAAFAVSGAFGQSPAGWVVQWTPGRPPTLVEVEGGALSNITQVAVGHFHALGLRSDGSVAAWGANLFGETTVPPEATNIVQITAARHFSAALRRDGRIFAWGQNARREAEVPPTLTNAIAIAAGEQTLHALTVDGQVVMWPQRESPWPGVSNVMQIAIGEGARASNVLLLQRDGTLRFFYGTARSCVPTAGVSNVITAAVGFAHALGLRNDGTVLGWGANTFGEATGVPTTGDGRIASGFVKLGGEALSGVAAIAASRYYSLALKTDGSLVAWGDSPPSGPRIPEGLSNVVAIAAGERFCLAVTTNAAVAERFRR